MGETISGHPRKIEQSVIPGGAVGDHVIDGDLDPDGDLISVRHVSSDFVTNTDLTGEFSIKAGTHNTLTNTTTDTTGDFLIVTYAPSEQ